MRAVSFTYLAAYLSHRYGQLGGMGDLEEAVVFSREALVLCPQGHPDRWKLLKDLAAYLSSRYNLLGGRQDLDEGISVALEAPTFVRKDTLIGQRL